MYYKIVKRFSPSDGDKWRDYLAWRKLPLLSFQSIDGILRPDLFRPASHEDWRNCVNADYRWTLITNLDYAKRVLQGFDNATLVGVDPEIESDYAAEKGLLGFDILDESGHVSLIANWGTDDRGLIDPYVSPEVLITDPASALELRNRLRRRFSEDPHARRCCVWAIYHTDA